VELNDEAIRMLIEALPSLPGGDCVTIVGRDGTLSLWAKDADAPDWTVLEVPGAVFTGSPVAGTALDRHYVLDALKAGLMRTLVFSDELSPVLSESGDGGTHVLMPMRDGLPNEIREAIAGLARDEAQTPEAEEPKAKEPEIRDDNVNPNPSGIAPDSKEDPVPETKPERKKPETEKTPMERVLLACDSAKAKLTEARQEIAGISAALREAMRDQKQQAKEMEQARQALTKLQAINL